MRKMRIDHKASGMLQTFIKDCLIWILLCTPHPKILVLCSFVLVCLMKKTLRTYRKLAVLIYTQHGSYVAKLPKEKDSPWVVQFHMPDSLLPAGTTFASITLFFIYPNKWILETFYVSGPTQNLRVHTCGINIGPACHWRSHSFLLLHLCTCTHNFCSIWCQGTMGDQLWATEILLSIVIRKKVLTYTPSTHQLFLIIIS